MTSGARVVARDATEPTPWAWLVALVIVATVVRVIGLNSGLWIDEIYSVVDHIRPPLGTILTHFASDTQHPMYMPLAHLSTALFGESPWTVRLPSVLFGIASIPMLYALGALVASRREALLAAGLLAVSYHHVWFSQNARGYSMLAFWTLLSTYFLIRAVREGRWRLYAGFAIAAAFGVYTHLTMVFMLMGQALACVWLLLRRDPRDERWPGWSAPLRAFALAGALTLVLYAPMLREVHDFFRHKASTMRGVSTPTWALGETLQVLKIGFGGLGLAGTVVLAAGGILVACGVLSFVRQSRFLALLLLTPGLLIFLGALAARGTMYPRFYFLLIGFGVLIVVRGGVVTGEWVGRRILGGRPAGTALGTAMVGAMIVVSALSLPYGWRYPKQDFEGALRYVEAHRSPNDQVVTLLAATYPYRRYYGRQWASAATGTELASIREEGKPVWVVYTLVRYLERREPQLVAMLKRECQDRHVFRGTLAGGDVGVCRLDPVSRR